MNKAFLWSDEYENVYGRHDDFNSEDEFVIAAIKEYGELTDEKCELADVKVKTCLHSNIAIEADVLIPTTLVNVNTMNWYTAKVKVIQTPHTCGQQTTWLIF
ncbi:hypothetical protein [Paenibacillus sp. OK003]|uniref:hypothetical protein n=1 Tax=Paenibacillus sp. OK003 TaxID=1884380 RepID=UPI0008BA45BE|nr:hypothetical protein [Paenibacillus sp. OK003]SEL31077.1 hypothetical protein SAMN05518856_109246 [Paenibacillus sp. OK003]